MTEKLQKYEGGGEVDVQRPKPVDIEALLVAAMEKGPDVVERMMVVRRELNAEASKRACDEAVRRFQKLCPRIGKTKGVPTRSGSIAYRYSPFEEIIQVSGPILDECGLSYSFDQDTSSDASFVTVTCEISHVGGHSFKKTAKFPLGAKTEIMSLTQQYAAALSFANRRVFCNALGIVTVGDDQDGQEAWRAKQKSPMKDKREPVQPQGGLDPQREAVRRLWALLKPVRGEAQSWDVAHAWLLRHKIMVSGDNVTKMPVEMVEECCNKASIQLDLDAGK